MVIVEYKYNPLSYHTLYSNTSSYLNDIFFATPIGTKVDVIACPDTMSIYFPINLYDNSQKDFIQEYKNSTFYGALDLKDLIIARQDACLEDLIVTSYPYVYGNELIDDCIEKLKDYSENSIPVLDNDNKLLGVITSQSIVELVDDEMGEDYAMFAFTAL